MRFPIPRSGLTSFAQTHQLALALDVSIVADLSVQECCSKAQARLYAANMAPHLGMPWAEINSADFREPNFFTQRSIRPR